MMRTRIAVSLVWVAFFGCAAQQYRISTSPSLRPVDAARAMVVFSQIQGRACGRDAVLGAIRDMKRLGGVDGYLEVVVEESGEGDHRCAKVTAYPFRYGTATDTPTLRAGDEDLNPVSIEGRDACTSGARPLPSADPPAVNCAKQCERISVLVASGTIKQALAKDRCVQRCEEPDAAFAACIAAATDAVGAASCMARSADTTEVRP